LFVQVSFSVPDLVRWREQIDFDGPVYVGVMAPPSATMARKLSAGIAQLAVPSALIQALESDRDAGVKFASEMVTEVRDSGVFEGIHLVPVSRYRELAALLDPI